jgi:thiamine biosynthesis lipoprotein
MTGAFQRSAIRLPAVLAGIILFAVVLTAQLGGCNSNDPNVLLTYQFNGDTMGTTWDVKVVCRAIEMYATREETIQHAIQSRLNRIENLVSTYKPDSELSRFNRFADTQPFHVSPETFAIFTLSQQMSIYTNGSYDVTVGPLVNAWGFGPVKASHSPSDAEIAALMPLVGFEKLSLDATASTVAKANPGMYCDLSSIGDGYGSDEVARALDSLECKNYRIDVGGEIRTKGTNASGLPWHIGIQQPNVLENAAGEVVLVSGESVSTSGDYRKYEETADGRRITHIIDPATGRPISHRLASATVIGTDCATADGYSTAIMVLGPEKGYQFALENELAAYLLVHSGDGGFTALSTPAFKEFVKPLTRP